MGGSCLTKLEASPILDDNKTGVSDMTNNFTVLKTAMEGDKFRKACVTELNLAVGAHLWGRVEAIALLLVLLEDDSPIPIPAITDATKDR